MIDPSGPSGELADEVRVELIRTAAATGRWFSWKLRA